MVNKTIFCQFKEVQEDRVWVLPFSCLGQILHLLMEEPGHPSGGHSGDSFFFVIFSKETRNLSFT